MPCKEKNHHTKIFFPRCKGTHHFLHTHKGRVQSRTLANRIKIHVVCQCQEKQIMRGNSIFEIWTCTFICTSSYESLVQKNEIIIFAIQRKSGWHSAPVYDRMKYWISCQISKFICVNNSNPLWHEEGNGPSAWDIGTLCILFLLKQEFFGHSSLWTGRG